MVIIIIIDIGIIVISIIISIIFINIIKRSPDEVILPRGQLAGQAEVNQLELTVHREEVTGLHIAIDHHLAINT